MAFVVLCAEDLGSLHIVTSTEGRVLDPDGYSVTVDGDVEEALGIDDEVTLPLKPGTHTITLQAQAANCAPRGLPEATATVPFGDTKDVTFELVCFGDPIVFERERNSDGRDLWVVDANGGPEVRVTDDPVNLDYSGLSISGSAWNPGRTHVVFQSAPVSSFTDYDIYVLALNKSEMFHLHEDGTQVQPQWSPDGSRILFGDFGPGRFADIFVADPQLTEVTNITQSAVWENAATWSPDGSRILAVADPASGPPSGALVVFNADGSGRVDLSEIIGGHDAGVNDQDPRWSPDGSKIAFLRYREENLEGDIWVADADGSNAVRLTDTPNDRKFELLWSPDGSTLYYSLCPDCTTSSGPAATDVWAMAVDGSSNVQVTDSGDEAPGAFNATTTFAGEVPAGTSLVTVNGILSIGLQLYRMAPDGSGRVAITSTQGSANNPHWR